MFRFIDNLLLRFEEAYIAFRNPFHSHEQWLAGLQAGKEIGFAQVRQQFDTFDPYNIDNQHFQMGYYYAKEQAKKVMTDDSKDNGVGEA